MLGIELMTMAELPVYRAQEIEALKAGSARLYGIDQELRQRESRQGHEERADTEAAQGRRVCAGEDAGGVTSIRGWWAYRTGGSGDPRYSNHRHGEHGTGEESGEEAANTGGSGHEGSHHASGHATEDASHADPGLLAHLAGLSADPWFAYRLGAHRHGDDVDREVQEHIQRTLHIQEIAHPSHDEGEHAEELGMHHLHGEETGDGHLEHFPASGLHHSFAEWWLDWHGHGTGLNDHTAAHAGDEEEHADGHDHETHDATFGRHVAEWYWHLMHAWGQLHHAHGTHDQGIDAGGHHGTGPGVGHEDSAEHAEEGGHAGSHDSGAGEEGIDCNGFRHGHWGQADSWWMYRSRHHEEAHNAAAGHGPEGHSHSDSQAWRRMALGISAYTEAVVRMTPLMAGHELPPTE